MAIDATAEGITAIWALKLAIEDLNAACESLQDARAELKKIGLEDELVTIGSHINYADIKDLTRFVVRFTESLEKKVSNGN